MQSREEIIAELERQDLIAQLEAQDAETPSAESDRPWYAGIQDLSEGIGVSMLETGYGLKDLIPGMEVTDENRATLKAWKEAAGESGWGTAGRIGGEVAQLAVPGGAGLKAARALSAANKASKTARALPLAADVAGVTAHGAVRLPGEDESRLQNAMSAAQWGLGGAAAGKVLKGALTGARGTEAAQRLRDAGAKLTAGQTLGRPAAALENILTVTPFFARPLARARQKSEESISRIAMREAAPPTIATLKTAKPVPMEVKNMGQKGVDELYDGFQQGYNDAWGAMRSLNPRVGGKIDYIAKQGKKRLTKGQRRKVDNVLSDMNDVYKASPDGSAQELDVILKNAIVGSKKSREVDRVIKDIRQTLRSGLPKESQTALKRLDEKWPKYLAVEAAAAVPASAKKAKVGVPGEFGVDELFAGSAKAGTTRTTGRGKSPLQGIVNDWYRIKGAEKGILPTKALRIIQSPLFSDYSGLQGTINRRIAGTGLGQKAARDLMQEEWAKQLRYGISGARLGAAYED
jgi:hypothetical protein